MEKDDAKAQPIDDAANPATDEAKAADEAKAVEAKAPEKEAAKQEAVDGKTQKATDNDSSDDDDFLKVDKTGADENAENEKKAAQSKAPDVPDDYEKPTIPEGLTFDDALFGALTPTFKEMGLRQEQVDQLVTKFAKQAEAQAAEAQAEQDRAYAEQDAKHKQELKEHFGDQYSEKSAAVGRVFRRYDTDGSVGQFFKESGLTNFPPLMKMLAEVGSALSEGGHLESASGVKTTAPRQPHEQLWGSG
ncbi:MAG: hypothetical protein AAF225_10120 [Pseudomonadota bacterium]